MEWNSFFDSPVVNQPILISDGEQTIVGVMRDDGIISELLIGVPSLTRPLIECQWSYFPVAVMPSVQSSNDAMIAEVQAMGYTVIVEIDPDAQDEDTYEPPFDIMRTKPNVYSLGGQYDTPSPIEIASIVFDEQAIKDDAIDDELMQGMARLLACSQDILITLQDAAGGLDIEDEALILSRHSSVHRCCNPLACDSMICRMFTDV